MLILDNVYFNIHNILKKSDLSSTIHTLT